MNRMLFLIIALTVAAPAAVAVEEHHPKETAATGAPQSQSQALQQMRRNVRIMQTQMDRISSARDAAERQRLLQEHLNTLRQSMQAASSLAGRPAMGGMMDEQMMQHCKAMHNEMLQRMDKIDARLEAMQNLLQRSAEPQPPAHP